MKNRLLFDILQITLLYVVFIILVILFDTIFPSIIIFVASYLVSLGILWFFDCHLAQKRQSFEDTFEKYEALFPHDTWTKVILKPETHEKLGLFFVGDNSSESFYARTYVEDFHSKWKIPKVQILIATLQEGEEISEKVTDAAKYEIPDFEEYFQYEEKQVD